MRLAESACTASNSQPQRNIASTRTRLSDYLSLDSDSSNAKGPGVSSTEALVPATVARCGNSSNTPQFAYSRAVVKRAGPHLCEGSHHAGQKVTSAQPF